MGEINLEFNATIKIMCKHMETNLFSLHNGKIKCNKINRFISKQYCMDICSFDGKEVEVCEGNTK